MLKLTILMALIMAFGLCSVYARGHYPGGGFDFGDSWDMGGGWGGRMGGGWGGRRGGGWGRGMGGRGWGGNWGGSWGGRGGGY